MTVSVLPSPMSSASSAPKPRSVVRASQRRAGLGGTQLGTIIYMSPIYLSRVLGMSQAEVGYLIWIPTLGWGIGYYFFGWVADRWVGDHQRPVLLYLLLAAGSLPLVLVTHTDSTAAVLALFFWGMFTAVGFITVSLHVAARGYPQDQTGMVAGIGSGAWGAVLALIMLFLGRWFDHKEYATSMWAMALMPVLGTLLWLWISKPSPRAQ